MKKRIGILELTALPRTSGWGVVWNSVFAPRYASVMSQAVAVWLRQAGHEVFYAVYHGYGTPHELVPGDLDFLFVVTTSRTATLAERAAGAAKAVNRRLVVFACGPHCRGLAEPLPWADATIVTCDRLTVRLLVQYWSPGDLLVNETFDPAELPGVRERADLIRSAFSRLHPRWAQVVSVLTSTGCPNRCDFCVDHDSRYRQMPDEAVRDDLAAASELFPGAIVAFHDPNWGLRMADVLRWIVEMGSRNHYIAEVELRHLKPEVVPLLRQARVMSLTFGVESFKDFNYKTNTPGLSPREKVLAVVDKARMLERYVTHPQDNMMVGFDHDDEESAGLIKEFIDETPFAWCNINVTCAFPGTPLRTKKEQDGAILSLPGEFYCAPFLTHRLPVPVRVFYERLLDVYEHQLCAMRQRCYSLPLRRLAGQLVRVPFVRDAVRNLRVLLQDMDRSNEIARFHDGKTLRMPTAYREYQQKWLGPYRDMQAV